MRTNELVKELKDAMAKGEDVWINFINFASVAQAKKAIQVLTDGGYVSDNVHAPQQTFRKAVK